MFEFYGTTLWREFFFQVLVLVYLLNLPAEFPSLSLPLLVSGYGGVKPYFPVHIFPPYSSLPFPLNFWRQSSQTSPSYYTALYPSFKIFKPEIPPSPQQVFQRIFVKRCPINEDAVFLHHFLAILMQDAFWMRFEIGCEKFSQEAVFLENRILGCDLASLADSDYVLLA